MANLARFRPTLRYELLDCALHGHELLGTGAARLRPEDDLFAREIRGLRWYRCLRCDSWIEMLPPAPPTSDHPPGRDEVVPPLRGRGLRQRYVLRLIAIERSIHFLVLSALAAAVLIFAGDKTKLNADFSRILNALQGGLGGPVRYSKQGIVADLQHLFAVSTTNLDLIGAGIAVYAALEGVESVGLWYGRRWAEYLTFLATAVFVPYEVYELTRSVSTLKIVALVLNLAVVIYLLVAKRLFGLRGGGRAERAALARESGWEAIQRATPQSLGAGSVRAGSAGARPPQARPGGPPAGPATPAQEADSTLP